MLRLKVHSFLDPGFSQSGSPPSRRSRPLRMRWVSVIALLFFLLQRVSSAQGCPGFVCTDGTTQLTANWNAGQFDIHSKNSRRWFNARDGYGADPTGAADATTAIQGALNAANTAGGGIVYLPPTGSSGFYLTSSTLTVPPGVSLVGDGGYDQTIIKANHTGTAIAFSSTSTTNYFSELHQISVRRGANVPARLVDISNAWFVRIRDCLFEGGSSEAVRITSTTGQHLAHVYLENCMFRLSPAVCVRIMGEFAHDVVLKDNEITTATAGGVVVEAMSGGATVFMYGNVIEGNTGAGVRVEAAASGNGVALLSLHGNYFENNTGYHVDINPGAGTAAPPDVTIVGSFAWGSGVTPGFIRMNAKTRSLTVLGGFAATHTTADIVLGDLSATTATVNIEGIQLNSTTKISSTNPTTTATTFKRHGGNNYADIRGGERIEITPVNVSYPTPGIASQAGIHIIPATGLVDGTTAITFGANAVESLVNTDTHAGIYVQTSGGYGSKMRFATTDSFATGAKERMLIDHYGRVGIGTSTIASGQALEVNGGVTLNTATAKPACSATTRGTLWVTQGAAGVKDSVEVCAKDAADAYAWRPIY